MLLLKSTCPESRVCPLKTIKQTDRGNGCALPEDVKYWNEKVTFKKVKDLCW